MELVLVPMTMKFASFTGFVYVWTAVAAVAAAAGLFCRKDILEDVRALAADWKSFITPGASGCAGADHLPVMVSASSYVPGMG